MAHIVLLGDSIFDNKSYVGAEGKDVITHLRETIPADWQATLKAIDGSVAENVLDQIPAIPADATHIVISAGGNDALMNAGILEMKADSAAEVLNKLAAAQNAFEANYREMLHAALAKNLPLAVCTVYYPNFPDAMMQRLAVTALSVFNDAIIRQAILNKIPFLDLRLICDEPADYANPIEPSDAGGKKIAAKIYELVREHDFSRRRCAVFA